MISVVLDSMKHLTGFSEDERSRIVDDLLIDNPAYLSAKKYSKWSTVRLPQYIEYFSEKKGVLTVPLHYNIPFKFTTKSDMRNENTVSYPKFQLKLRDTQIEAYRAYIADTDKGVIVMPTGKGKSILGLYLASKLKQKTLVLVHKDDLVEGWKADAQLCFGGAMTTGLIKAKKRQVGDQVTIATIQTLNRLTEQEIKKLSNEFGMIIIDEMHHIGAQVYDIISEFNSQYKIGLSATPERSDGMTRVMKFYLGDPCFIYKYDANDKDILPVEIIKRSLPKVKYMPQVIECCNRRGETYYRLAREDDLKPLKIDIEDIEHRYRPQVPFFTIDDEVVNNAHFALSVCADIVQESIEQNHSCVAFFSQKKHIEAYRDLLVSLGFPEDKLLLYYGDNKNRKTELKRAESKQEVLLTLATYKIATEGTNVKAWEVGFLVSSLADGKNVEQAIGRTRRSNSGKLKTARIYDYRVPNVYILKNHGAKRDDRYRILKFSSEPSNPAKREGLFSRGYKF